MMLKSYDGTRDPQVHVTMSESMMLVDRASDPFLYRTFLTFLEKAALLWFLSLPAKTIHNFAKLSWALWTCSPRAEFTKKPQTL